MRDGDGTNDQGAIHDPLRGPAMPIRVRIGQGPSIHRLTTQHGRWLQHEKSGLNLESSITFWQDHRPKVLVADDERVIADTLAVILNQSGFEAAAVYDGAEAVEKARTWGPDLLVSDVVMPELSGIDAAIRICAMFPGCRVLLFSGQAATADLLADARISGHNFEVLAKPIHPNELLAHLRTFETANI